MRARASSTRMLLSVCVWLCVFRVNCKCACVSFVVVFFFLGFVCMINATSQSFCQWGTQRA